MMPHYVNRKFPRKSPTTTFIEYGEGSSHESSPVSLHPLRDVCCLQSDSVAMLFQAMDRVAGQLVGGQAFKVWGGEIMKRNSILHHMIRGDQDTVSHRRGCLPPPRRQSNRAY